MKKEDLRIIFMGTPEFAVGILDSILKNNYTVVGVITAADKPAGRGQKIKYSAIKEYALEKVVFNCGLFTYCRTPFLVNLAKNSSEHDDPEFGKKYSLSIREGYGSNGVPG